MNDLFDLTGKVAVVTGSSTGLGQGMAIGLAKAGASVALVDRVDSTDTKTEIEKLGMKAEIITADFSFRDQVKSVIPKVVEQFGTVDILVNNAGIIRREKLLEFSEENWDDVININLNSIFILSQIAARVMVEKKYGKIINVASLLSFQGGIWVPSYTASKGGVAQLTKAFANELASSGVNCNAIAPGYMVTNNTTNLRKDKERFESISARIPAGRWGTPEDLQGAVVFLASHASDYVTGHVLLVDGGWMAR
jgi:2-deoxy-D-gluconate 3-dehydrogenase